jgi:hypothetical protein
VQDGKWLRRIAGFLSARLPELKLKQVADPRSQRGKRWKIDQMLRALLVGLMSGARNLRDIEARTSELSPQMARMLGLCRRLPDTTARALLVKLEPDALRAVLHQAIRVAKLRKAIEPVLFPFGVVAMDGKGTALPSWDKVYAQRVVNDETHHAYGHLRTMTSTLISVPARPCIDAFPIHASTNEMGAFQAGFAALCLAHGDLFSLVTYDAGAAGEDNAAFVVAQGKDYFLRLNDERRLMQKHAQDLLRDRPHRAETTDVLNNKTTVTRRVYTAPVVQTGKSSQWVWAHTKTLVRVTSETKRDGQVACSEERFYATSLPSNGLSADQWLLLARQHWAVEVTHNVLDTALSEDDHPFITFDPQGALAVMLLRRIAYTLLALFRGVTLRSDENRAMPWKDLLRKIYNALIAANDDHVSGLRQRSEPEPAFV